MIGTIDALHMGVPRAICVYHGSDWVLDPGPESTIETVVDALPEGFELRRVLLTHIHFDHAGATGALLERWPGAEVWVHERGAPHIVDPERLVASARRLYGDKFDELWGKVVPVADDHVRVLRGGEAIDGWRVEYTPGHASHHVCYLQSDSGVAFCGDVAGVRISEGPAMPPTPPPDIDVEQWLSSIETVRAWSPTLVACTHFGTFSDVDAQLDEVGANLKNLAQLSRDLDADAFGESVAAHITQRTTRDATRDAYMRSNPPETLWGGLDRYWRKRAEREGDTSPESG